MDNVDLTIFDYARIIFSLFSLLGCFSNFLDCIIILSSRTLKNYLIIFQQIGNLMTSLALIVPYFHHLNSLCLYQGFLIESGTAATAIWSGIISLEIYLKHVKRKENLRQYFVVWILFGLFVPFILSTMNFVRNDYKNIGYDVC